MCMYSLETNQKVTKAKIGDVLIRGTLHGHSVLTNEKGQLRCVRHGTELQVEKFDVDMSYFGNKIIGQPNRPAVRRNRITKWQGKPVTIKLVRWIEPSNTQLGADAVELPDGAIVHINWLTPGMRMTRARKPRKDRGLRKPRNLDRLLGLDQIKADIPVRKREAVKD